MTDRPSPLRELLDRLKHRWVAGEIDEPTYDRMREKLLADLSAEERAALGISTPPPSAATPPPGTPSPSPRPGAPFATPGPSPRPTPLGPSGAAKGGIKTARSKLADLDLPPGTILLDQWRVVRELGRGGFGAVFEAEELHLHELQAIKVLDPAMVAKDELLARFRREVSLMRKLVHPRIVRVYDYREDPSDLLALISMELVPHGSVKQLLAEARRATGAGATGAGASASAPASAVAPSSIPIPLALTLLDQILEALAEAHKQGVIHRDVTPGNVLLAGATPRQLLADPQRDPQVKLVDFGIAGLVERTELSAKSRVLGTAAYVAPEVLDASAAVTAAADVYGAGAMAYELLTGVLPSGRFENPKELRPELPEAIDGFLMRLLERRPERRPNAAQARADLAGAIEQNRREVARRLEEEQRNLREAEQRRLDDERRRQDDARRRQEEALRQQEEERRKALADAQAREIEKQKEEAQRRERQRQEEARLAREAAAAQAAAEAARAASAAAGEAERRAREAQAREIERQREEAQRREKQRQEEARLAREAPPRPFPPPPSMEASVRSETRRSSSPLMWIVLVTFVGILAILLGQNKLDRPRAGQVPVSAPATPSPASSSGSPTIRWVRIPGGSFTMGCTSGDTDCANDEIPARRVTVRGFQMAETETTVSQYRACVSAGRCRALSGTQAGGDYPVVSVDWNESKAYCEWAGGRLPSEAEWEYAARGGREGSKYPWGNEAPTCSAGAQNGAQYSSCSGTTAPVKRFASNGFGLYDMAGNVWEWVADPWHSNYSGAPSDGSVWSSGGVASPRVVRGGSWDDDPRYLRVSSRSDWTPVNRGDYVGFRCARTEIP